jgi:hypothetical protein
LQWVNGSWYAGGGGGNGYGGTQGTGGLGGGASATSGQPGLNGNTNTGGGASGGAYSGGELPGGTGGSGIVIVRWPIAGAVAFANTGSNVLYTNTGGYHTYRFYSSGTLTP